VKRFHQLLAVGLVLGLAEAPAADLVFATPRLRLAIAEGVVASSLRALPGKRECLPSDWQLPLASVTVGAKRHDLCKVIATPTGLTMAFADCDTTLDVQVEAAPDWLRFTLREIRGTRPSAMDLLRVPIGIRGTIGRKLNIVYDERTAVCVLAAGRQVECRVRGSRHAYLSASSQDEPGPKLEGASAALIVCPPQGFPAIAQRAAHAFGLPVNETPDGVPAKETEAVRGSYYFIGFGEQDVDRMVAACQQAGIRQVMLNSGAWCRKVGHYELNQRNYPHGLAGLKGTVDRLHEAGILVGLHCFASKISKTDPYLTPVPDRRFWVQLRTRLAAGVTADQTEIQVQGDLRDWPGCKLTAKRYWEGGVQKHREVILDDEIIQFETIGPEGVWNTFQGCKRGAWRTVATAHAVGTEGRHYGVDGCINGYIIDQETSLLDEAQDRLAHVFNTCGFDMVYFDGGEDVDRRRFDYYVTNFQANAMAKFTKRPILHMGTIMTHGLWHSFARSGTVDTYLNTLSGAIVGGKPPETWPTVRDHIDRSVAYLQRCRTDLMPGELGWFGIWPRREFHGKQVEGLQLDEVEYLMARSLAYDAPVSLQTSFRQMDSHPLTPEILRVFRTYEELRLARAVPADEREKLAEKGANYALVQHDGKRQFVRLGERFQVGGNPDVYGLVGAFRDGSVATVWHAVRDGKLILGVEASASDFAGEPVLVRKAGDGWETPLDTRRLTLFSVLSPAALRKALVEAKAETRPPAMVLVRAEQARRLTGAMRLGSKAGIREEGAHGDVLACLGQTVYTKPSDSYAEYEIGIPRAGLWTVWARVRYPTGSDMSFGFVPDGQTPIMQGDQVLGNCGRNDRQWHWTGRGGGSTTVPPGEPIRLRLPEGRFRFRIYGRESTPDAATTPRLDLLLFVEGDGVVPTDALAVPLLK
jgi:hypothetical protein